MTRKSLALEVQVTVGSREVDEDTKRIGLKIKNGIANSKEASVLRDTGCTFILVAEKLIKKEDLTGGVREVTLANGCVMKCPEVWIEFDTNHVKDKVLAIVMNTSHVTYLRNGHAIYWDFTEFLVVSYEHLRI